jgi:hypothetical protein
MGYSNRRRPPKRGTWTYIDNGLVKRLRRCDIATDKRNFANKQDGDKTDSVRPNGIKRFGLYDKGAPQSPALFWSDAVLPDADTLATRIAGCFRPREIARLGR